MKITKFCLMLVCTLMLAGCASGPEQLQAVIDELAFSEGEQGCVRAQAAIDLNANPFASATANIILIKTTGEGAPPC